MSETEITFLDTKVYEGVRFDKEAILASKHISNQQQHSSTQTSTRVTHQA